MAAKIKLLHAAAAANVPPTLDEGELAVNGLVSPPELWTANGTGNINLLDPSKHGGPFLPLTGGTLAGPGNLVVRGSLGLGSISQWFLWEHSDGSLNLNYYSGTPYLSLVTSVIVHGNLATTGQVTANTLLGSDRWFAMSDNSCSWQYNDHGSILGPDHTWDCFVGGGVRLRVAYTNLTLFDPLVLNPLPNVPAAPTNGMIYYDQNSHTLQVRANGVWRELQMV